MHACMHSDICKIFQPNQIPVCVTSKPAKLANQPRAGFRGKSLPLHKTTLTQNHKHSLAKTSWASKRNL